MISIYMEDKNGIFEIQGEVDVLIGQIIASNVSLIKSIHENCLTNYDEQLLAKEIYEGTLKKLKR